MRQRDFTYPYYVHPYDLYEQTHPNHEDAYSLVRFHTEKIPMPYFKSDHKTCNHIFEIAFIPISGILSKKSPFSNLKSRNIGKFYRFLVENFPLGYLPVLLHYVFLFSKKVSLKHTTWNTSAGCQTTFGEKFSTLADNFFALPDIQVRPTLSRKEIVESFPLCWKIFHIQE